MSGIINRLFLAAVFVVATWSAAAQQATAPVLIRNVNVIPMDREEVLRNYSVLIENGRVKTVGPSVKAGPNTTVIDGKGRYLLPGLAEMHAHIPPTDDEEQMKKVLNLFLASGITTIRGMLGHPAHLALREKIRSGTVRGPHFYTTGPSFNGMSVNSPEAGSRMVIAQKNAGYDFLKLHPGLLRQEFDSIAATAQRVGIPFAGHVSNGVGIRRATEARYSSIDHLDGIVEGLVPGIEKMREDEIGLFGMFVASGADTARIGPIVSALARNGVAVVPTQSLAEKWFSPDYTGRQFMADPHVGQIAPEVAAQWVKTKEDLTGHPRYNADDIRKFIALRRKIIKACQDAGVRLLLGCDAPQVFNIPGISTHDELVYLVKSGLTPYQALATGTTNVAAYLGKPGGGVIRPGAPADLMMVSGNPLTDIANSRNVEGVVLSGQWFSREALDAALKP